MHAAHCEIDFDFEFKARKKKKNFQTLPAHSAQKRKVKKIKCRRRQSEIIGSKDTKEKHVSHSARKKYDL